MNCDDPLARYEQYLSACNRHALAEIGDFLAPEICVNGEVKTAEAYAADLARLFEVFPDYHWRLVRTVVQDAWLAVHLHDSGTRTRRFLGAPADGARVSTDEFAMYHFDQDGRIDHVEVTADNARLAAPK
ncbi:ester cyclase [Arsenicicoccus bolidensis]|uniref:Ester cyclase n=1 Tax=Arsenicicoccus bolidensis TaxID=229480 RepID=A0ABS9PZT6_9MICO|nr:ester cyclase [Arsenicicoccus bolidensis]MCG7321138.1 ester cyclase [Arsenicicoccus bolidensis]